MSEVQQMLRLSYAEMLTVEVFLGIVLKTAKKETRRACLVKLAHTKIRAALDQAERDGLIDTAALAKECGL